MEVTGPTAGSLNPVKPCAPSNFLNIITKSVLWFCANKLDFVRQESMCGLRVFATNPERSHGCAGYQQWQWWWKVTWHTKTPGTCGGKKMGAWPLSVRKLWESSTRNGKEELLLELLLRRPFQYLIGALWEDIGTPDTIRKIVHTCSKPQENVSDEFTCARNSLGESRRLQTAIPDTFLLFKQFISPNCSSAFPHSYFDNNYFIPTFFSLFWGCKWRQKLSAILMWFTCLNFILFYYHYYFFFLNLFSLMNLWQNCISVGLLMLLIAYSCLGRVCGCSVIFPERDKNKQTQLKQSISTDKNVLSLFAPPTSSLCASAWCQAVLRDRAEKYADVLQKICGTPILMQFVRPAACLCYSWFTALHARDVAAQSHGEKMVFVFKHTALLGRNVVCAFD